ncbi:hypothetical protein N7466_007873 [Penicillium verhagenii]|uniref:uncharacterized protein n=1 Tax=Penicillium verhagenii TaxID=1562060 RepID=UPI0025453B8E|nr:uncharacterized protein N7466_007873 [Penicillium verhagenii]KAJ5928917.1 hypothetical protein N7466_007873 [Penicillium verhagenii]
MSVSIRSALRQHNGVIRLIEAHDGFSTEVIRNAGGDDHYFEGVWISGLTQTTYLGVPDTELISPLHRAILEAAKVKSNSTNERLLCAAFDADSGGDIENIPALVTVLVNAGISMVIIEDKDLNAPGEKVNSLLSADGSQLQADPLEFSKRIQAFRKCAIGSELMVTARIESFNVRIKKNDPTEDSASIQKSLEDALSRAVIYTEAGVDAIMIHSKSHSSSEVVSFMRRFREKNSTMPLVVVPTTYSTTPRTSLVDAGANIIIYANHLMRAKIQAIEIIAQTLLAESPGLFLKDEEAKACLEAQNYGCLLRILLDRDFENGKNEEVKQFLVAAQKGAIENMGATVEELALGTQSGCEADARIIPVKRLLGINAIQVATV